jgi:hypothetical protein
MKSKIFVLAVILSFNHAVIAAQGALDQLLDFFAMENKASRITRNFHGLRFAIDIDTAACASDGGDRLTCRITILDTDGRSLSAQVLFEKNIISSLKSLALIRIKRKERWFQEYPSINQYIERDTKVGSFETRLQRCKYFRLDNIYWPVLIRAFDVVMNERTSIGVTTISDVRDWPAIEKEISKIELSLSRTAN